MAARITAVMLLCCAGCSSDAPASAAVSHTAAAQLTPFANASLQVSGTAIFRTTTEGVDLSVEIQSCLGGQQYAQRILEAASCAPDVMHAPVWSGGRGSSLPPVFCIGSGMANGATSYARLAKRDDAWTIGGAADSELTGRVLVVLDADSGEPLACGAITRTPDVVRTPVPPAEQSPRIETRAALGGLCFGRQFPDSGPGCPDARGVYECTNVHCDLGGCFEKCEAYLSCVDSQADVCAPAACELTPECTQCKSELTTCALGFCAEHLTCAPAITPDGPCRQLAACCVLQGDHADSCLGVLTPLLTSLGGDANCLGSMLDWDVQAHMHVPCKFGPPQTAPAAPGSPDVPAPDAGSRLPEGVAGVACATDAECPGGYCELAAAAGAGSYCTRACVSSYECGADGICSAAGAQGTDKRCLAKCQGQAECREGFICAGGLQGARLNLSGGCRPRRSVSTLADGVAGRACTQDAECSGGQCASVDLLGTSYPGNYCTGRCYDDAHCGEGGVCAWPRGFADPGHCLQACAADADCTREGYGCWQLGDGERVMRACYPRASPLPDGIVGEPCTEALDCGTPRASCAAMLPYAGFASNDLIAAPGGYCTQPCALDLECGSEGQCIHHGSEGGICLAQCSDSEPCRSGYTCSTHDRDGDPLAAICVPTETPTP